MNSKTNLHEELLSLVEIFKALGDSSRLKILNILLNSPTYLCVGMMAHNLNMTQPAVSQHLKILKNSGLVTADRKGFHMHYKVNLDKFEKINAIIKAYIDKKNILNKSGNPCESYPDKKGCNIKK